ncbi:hypothetical protein [Cellulomonas fimi]|uniref:Uncharacterized protein n=1 Tax=Cellulomonas fimi TaxID=1708 RepID=A0A7Y0QFW8_CELFI|nr:hypothetical protein [Cellulomonas fimi]NMR19471.1 hypothetical protein [Cellulomonas fimi]
MSNETHELQAKGPHVPTEERALRRLGQAIELGHLEDLTGIFVRTAPRYLVTYMNSQRGGRLSSATVVTVTNQSTRPNRVTVSWYKGFSDDTSPVGQSTFSIPPDYTVDFATRNLPGEVTITNSVPNPELTFDEGRAIVSSTYREIAVSARVYYARGDNDLDLVAVTDSKVVRINEGNVGD